MAEHYNIIYSTGKINDDATAQAIAHSWTFDEGDTCKYWYTISGQTPPDSGTAIGYYTYTSGSTWQLNNYYIHQGSGTTFVADAQNFSTTYNIGFVDHNKAVYTDAYNGESSLGNYQYNKKAWYMLFTEEVEFATLVPGSAATFRETLNENLEIVTSYGEHIDYNVDALRDSLQDVAFSGLASDLTTDATHRFATDTEKTVWNNRIWVESTESGVPIIYTGLAASKTDISSIVAGLIANQLPTKTSQLTNDSGYITGSQLNNTSLLYGTNIALTRSNFTADTTTYPGLFTHKCDIDLSNWENTHVTREPTIIFDHQDVVNSEMKLSTTCEWNDSTGHLYFWCNEFWADYPASTETVMTIPVIAAVVPTSVYTATS